MSGEIAFSKGRSNAAIASALVISERAVEKHITNIFTKLHITDRAQAVVRARLRSRKNAGNFAKQNPNCHFIPNCLPGRRGRLQHFYDWRNLCFRRSFCQAVMMTRWEQNK